MDRLGINIVGHVSGNLGLGVLARDVIDALRTREIPTAVFDVDPGGGRWKFDRRFEADEVQDVNALLHEITLFMLDPQTLAEFVLAHPDLLLREGSFNVAHTMWELPVLPTVMTRTLGLFDALVAESKFLQSTLERNVPHVPTFYAEHPLQSLTGITASRKKFGLPEDAVIFVTSFDPHSDPVRKNAMAVIEAFKRRAGNDSQGFLVLKINGEGRSEGALRILQQVTEACRAHPRIRLVTENLPYDEVMSLYASCDVFVSLHRAEGLGLGLMEAMSLGKPVVATAWSGNMSFMDAHNSCLVSYELIPVEGSVEVYTERFLRVRAQWAEPNIEEAAGWMQRLIDDANLRSMLGTKAAESMHDYRARAKAVPFIDEIRAARDGGGSRRRTISAIQKELLWLKKATTPKNPSSVYTVGKVLKKTLDRHLLWRFKAHV